MLLPRNKKLRIKFFHTHHENDNFLFLAPSFHNLKSEIFVILSVTNAAKEILWGKTYLRKVNEEKYMKMQMKKNIIIILRLEINGKKLIKKESVILETHVSHPCLNIKCVFLGLQN